MLRTVAGYHALPLRVEIGEPERSGRFMRYSSHIDRIASIMAWVAAAYLCAYMAVRVTHTKHWFDKSTEETGSYTFFDTWSQSDTLLYRAFYPMLVLDSAVLRRPFERDKW